MSEVLKRTVFYETVNGNVRFQDWALATTSIGTMAEPFNVNNRHVVNTNTPDFDYTDSTNRVDEMREIDSNKLLSILSGGNGGGSIHGGNLLPRLGR